MRVRLCVWWLSPVLGFVPRIDLRAHSTARSISSLLLRLSLNLCCFWSCRQLRGGDARQYLFRQCRCRPRRRQRLPVWLLVAVLFRPAVVAGFCCAASLRLSVPPHLRLLHPGAATQLTHSHSCACIVVLLPARGGAEADRGQAAQQLCDPRGVELVQGRPLGPGTLTLKPVSRCF